MSKRHPGSKHYAALNKRRWAATRRAAFRRDKYRCRNCGKAGRLEGHHIKRLEDGGDPYDPDNVLTYCRGCHIAEHTPEHDPQVAAWLNFIETAF